jgi:hypothetical protein
MFKCCLCDSFAAPRFIQVVRHIGKIHSFDPNFSITCGIDGCTSHFKKFSAYRSHFYRKHNFSRDTEEQQEACADDSGGVDPEVEIETTLGNPKPTVQDAAARFLLMMKEARRLSQQAVSDVSVGVVKLMTAKLDELQDKVMVALDSDNLTVAKERVASLFEDEHHLNPFRGLETQYQQEKYYKRHFNLLVPTLLVPN